ncbi:DUF917 domain-containing protein [Sinisalibacter aestuarii]|uniref:DUF917 domain-containing protein n=1 Tax=Sinisalibacter aestuarii TaxID=2949426 RepID=A0ABQ5LST6_9RHOB|nr:DUF917 domain-containing protein [Sinisalibacter aestuarii]GKY87381.1 hypothetical protein STA1M1_12500 [Sinisalibacter aestuarii]
MMTPVMNVDKPALRRIARGGAVLGSGGGGDPYIGRLMAEQELGDDKTVPVVSLDDLPDDALILPIAMMGAPHVMLERFPSGREIPALVATMEKLMGRKVSAILCIEAGGLNSVIPFIAAAQMGLPIVDGDAMGRAFPELQMVTFTLAGIRATPMAMYDDKGNGATFDTVSNQWTERLARALTIEMGGAAMVGLYSVTAGEIRDSLIKGSLTLAHRIGELIETYGSQAPETLALSLGGAMLFHGRVRDVERRLEGAFAKGSVKIEGQGDFRGRSLTLGFQNEFLSAEEDGRMLATTPDLITLIDANTGAPVPTDTVKYGLSVKVLGLPCDPIWRSEEALALVGPRYFGIDADYKPLDVA